MDDEVLWKWELLCHDFDEAKKNYISVFNPLFKNIGEKKIEVVSDDISVQIKLAQSAWENWLEIQSKLKEFVDENI